VARTHVVGLDIGTTHVRAAELTFGKAGPRVDERATLVRCGTLALPPGAVRDGQVIDGPAVSETVEQLWRHAGFRTKSVAIGVGSQRVVVRELELPWMQREDLKRSLPFQIADLLPMPVDEAVLDFYPTEETRDDRGRKVRGLLVAVGRGTVHAGLTAVESAGLRVSMVDLNAFALQRALVRGTYRERTVALVDVGAESTTVVVTARGVPKLVRTIASGGTDPADEIAALRQRALREGVVVERFGDAGPAGVALAESPSLAIEDSSRSLVESIRNTFVYYASHNPGAAIELALLNGSGADLPRLGQHLSRASRVAVAHADPLEWVDLGPALDGPLAGQANSLAVAIGLAHGRAS
jgi:type IV pilus assembly protein PilM